MEIFRLNLKAKMLFFRLFSKPIKKGVFYFFKNAKKVHKVLTFPH